MPNYFVKNFKEINVFTNVILPLIISFVGLTGALYFQSRVTDRNNRKKERQYLVSLKADLLKDISKLDSILLQIGITTKGLDSTLFQMQQPMNNITAVKLNYILSMKYDWFPSRVNFTVGTISQLKYTGNLTLITDSEVADSIGLYDVGISLCHTDGDIVLDSYKETFSSQKYVYNYKDRIDFQKKLGLKSSNELQRFSNDYLLANMSNSVSMATTDKAKIIACYNDFANYQASLKLLQSTLARQKRITKNLIHLIEVKYNI